MTHLTISSILILISGITSFIIILFHKPRSYLKNIWGAFNLSVILWSFGILQYSIHTEYSSSLFWWRFSNLSGLFIGLFIFHFSLIITNNIQRKHFVLICWYAATLLVLFTALLQPSTYIPNISLKIGSQYFANTGILYHFWIFQFLYLLPYSTFLLLRESRNTTNVDYKNQLKYVAVGSFIGGLGGATLFFPVYNINIFPWGNYLTPIYVIMSSYAIIKHQLMDIQIVIRKSIIYSISIATISLIYALSIFTLERLAQTIFNYHSLTISISTAFALGIFFIPIRQKIQKIMDRYFFKGSTEEISNQNKQLRQEITQSEKYKTLTTLATGIAHEVKNPLTAIKTFTEFLPHKLDDKEFLEKFSKIVGHEVNRIDQMIHELLDYGKPTPLSLQETDIHKLLNDTLDLLSSKFISKKISVIRTLNPKPYILNIDPNQIKQALLNILLNAIEAMSKGGTLIISTLTTSTSYFIIEIEDTGSGIKREDLSQVFDPFFSKKDQGTGLGLSITQSLIENHKGIIQIKSNADVGTTVTLELPLTLSNKYN